MAYIKGFNELQGKELVKKNYLDNVFLNVAYKNKFEEISIPILELASSFSEDVVGKSPWPEWNSKSMFQFSILNYIDDYNKIDSEQKVLLIPEGTISVTRWLGDRLNENNYLKFPIKVFYNLTCFRNELVDTLSKTKKREFHQFGFEILGSEGLESDAAILNILFECLESLGFDRKEIKVRVNDISIYNFLCEESGIESDDKVKLKELLDYYAECKAGKHAEEKENTFNNIFSKLKKYKINDNCLKKWEYLVNFDGKIDNYTKKIFGNKYIDLIEKLEKLRNIFLQNNRNLVIDFCVIRSHEYYTGISFEVDVIKNDKLFVEIAGGGRFDRLVSNFVAEKSLIVPCTGFAFGSDRVIDMLNQLDMFNEQKTIETTYKF